METKENTDLGPLEVLYLLHLGKEELYSLKNALLCMLANLYRRQILAIVRGGVYLSRRGHRVFKRGTDLNTLERLVCLTIKNGNIDITLNVISRADIKSVLLEKGLIQERTPTILFFFNAKTDYVLSSSGYLALRQLISEREKLNTGQVGAMTDIIFPSLFDQADPKMIALKNYVDEVINEYKKEEPTWLLPGKQYL
ncbi:hypothetical protein K9M09_02940 [Patescibacteria group bacterium]|nr:hypothetical protein [Patescibacteria group bacterium]